MKCIWIIATPPGEAPEEVRKRWVGLTLPLQPDTPVSSPHSARGIFSGEPQAYVGYEVGAVTAIEILGLHYPEAAKWWREKTFSIQPGYSLVFHQDVCEVVEGMPSIDFPGIPPNGSITVKQLLMLVKDQAPDGAGYLAVAFINAEDSDWQQLLGFHLTRPAVLLLANQIASHLGHYLATCGSDELYHATLAQGHAVLKTIHKIAVEHNVEVAIEEVDIPMSFAELFEREGVVEIREGNVYPSDKNRKQERRRQRIAKTANNN